MTQPKFDEEENDRLDALLPERCDHA